MPSPRARCRRGVVLPIALFLVLALGALATSVLVLVRAELLLERRAITYLEERGLEESWLDSPLEHPESGQLASDASIAFVPLVHGFLHVQAAAGAGGPRRSAVHWRLDPDSVAARLPGGLEVGRDPPPTGVERAASGCPASLGSGAALVRIRPPDPDPAPDPPLPPSPRLGILGVEQIAELPLTEVSGGRLPSDISDSEQGAPRILRATAGATLVGGEAYGLLFTSGDLRLGGDMAFRGLLLVAGDLRLEDDAVVEGVALVGGGAEIASSARILGCPAIAARALDHPELARLHAVPGGERLGRF